ncbi:helix-turn-helix domain-containing protein [Salinicola sp. JS01]|uniref:helix-turn-helix domain-containing protein n=1 Tax=Salinicola sp. JS01 TaxID=3050071 RepID=UPI00255C116C|nr:helix-turn-helix domain-containing protein [Salinicola sp. JS01]WIX33435.1 helix-turn-helix domain-containing protein [Salinicola sp. JS01]
MVTPTPVPTYQLYGETRHWPTPDLLHCETIAERSRLYAWHIRAHRHADLMHLLLLREGQVELRLGDLETAIDTPAMICVPATVIHGFRFSPQTQGHIVTLAQPLVADLHARLPQAEVLDAAMHYPLAAQPEAAPLAQLIALLDGEYRRAPGGAQEDREAMLTTLIDAVTLQLWRRARRRQRLPRSGQARGERHLERYRQLIETRFAEQPPIPDLAAELGIGDAHLNALCRRLTGHSALQLLHARLLLEAKRQLTYTQQSIAQVGERLGFAEPTYFTRFFKRGTGMTPRAFRQRGAGLNA